MNTTPALPDDLLLRYCEGFWGYGCLQSPVWIVGMEEGGARTPDEVLSKMTGWRQRGEFPVQDIRAVHAEPPLDRWFVGKGKLQPTWSKLVRLLLTVEGRDGLDQDAVRSFQRDELGRPDAGHALLELLPLPAPSAAEWPYGAWSTLPFLRSRADYEAEVSPMRLTALRTMVALHRPRVVVGYGLGHLAHWQDLAGGQLVKDTQIGATMWTAKVNGTLFMALPHPTARSMRPRHFVDAGLLAKRLCEAGT